jgi:hypothetical protein
VFDCRKQSSLALTAIRPAVLVSKSALRIDEITLALRTDSRLLAISSFFRSQSEGPSAAPNCLKSFQGMSIVKTIRQPLGE